jgi:hypothetical protein
VVGKKRYHCLTHLLTGLYKEEEKGQLHKQPYLSINAGPCANGRTPAVWP